jgi:FkbM family methyltransferase
MVVPILQGRLRGKRWTVGSGLHGYWLGSYELRKQKAIVQRLCRGDVFYDIGAHVGFYSLLAAQIVGQAGHVYSFEPLPRNIAYLEKHIAMNHLEDIVSVYECAISDTNGIARFITGGDSLIDSFMGRVKDAPGGMEIQTVSLDNLVERETLRPPSVLKIDIEGAEYKALQGANQLITAHMPTIFLATHGSEVHCQCMEYLDRLGYQLQQLAPDEIVASA